MHSTQSKRLLLIFWCIFVSLIVVGCGGGGSGDTTNVQPTSQNSGTLNTGTVVIEQVLLRAVPSQINRQRFTGFDSQGSVRFGPQTFNKAPRIELTNVSTAVTRLQIEYLQEETVIGLGVVPVVVVAGETTSVTDPPFDDVNAVLESIVVTPATATIAKGTSQRFTATGNLSDGTQQDLSGSVEWSSSSTTIATISSNGLATGVAPGVSSILARLGNKSGAAELTVSPATVTSVAVTPGMPSIANGTTQQFTAIATLSDRSTQNVTATARWTSNNAAAATVDGNGLATSVEPGETRITATVNGISGEATLTVTPAVVTVIQVTPTDSTIADGTTLQYTAIATFTDLSTQDVSGVATWVSSDTDTATIAPDGLVTAREPGTTNIRADFGGKTGQTGLTVTAATIVSIAVTPDMPSIADGTTQQFTAIATLTDSSTQDVTATASWTSNNTNAATVDGNGLATSVDPGETRITATVNGISGEATLTVTPAVVTVIQVTPTDSTIADGTTLQYTAIATFTDLSTQDVSGVATWVSSDTDTATIAPDGLVTAREPGTTNIRADFGGKTGQTGLTVTAATIVSIAVTPDMPSIADGTTQQFTAIATLTDSSTQDVTATASWTSNNTNAATVDGNGLATSVDPGETRITATVNGISGEATLTVTPGFFTRIERVSVNTNGVEGNGASNVMQLSADGSFVAFISFSSNLDSGDTNGLNDLYLRDRNNGTTELISKTDVAGAVGVSGISISGDGNRLAFSSTSVLLPGSRGQTSTYVFDRTLLTLRRFPPVSFGSETVSREGQLSFNGTIACFNSSTQNLAPPDNNGLTGFDIFIYDENTDSVERISQDGQGNSGNGGSSNADISSDGRFVTFTSGSTNLVPNDTNGHFDIFVFDRVLKRIERVSVSSSGNEGNENSSRSSISADGRYIAFQSSASNLVTNDTNGRDDVFVFDRNTKQTERISVNNLGEEANNLSSIPLFSSISDDGRFVVFSSRASNLVSNDTNNFNDTFVFDRLKKQISRVSISSTGQQGNGSSNYVQISQDGSTIAFTSTSNNLLSGDSNGSTDIFVVPNPFSR